MKFTLGLLDHFLKMDYTTLPGESFDHQQCADHIFIWTGQRPEKDHLYIVFPERSMAASQKKQQRQLLYICTPEPTPPATLPYAVLSDRLPTEVFNDIQHIYLSYCSWRQQVDTLLHSSQDLDRLLKISADFTKLKYWLLVDSEYHSIAYTQEDFQDFYAPIQPTRDEIQYLYLDNPDFSDTFKKDGVNRYIMKDMPDLFFYNIRKEQQYLARLLVIIPGSKVCPGLLSVIDYLGKVVTTFYTTYMSKLHLPKEKQELKAHLADIFQGRTTAGKELERLILRCSWLPSHTYQVIRFLPEPRLLSSQTLDFFCTQIENAFPHVIAIHFFNTVYGLANRSVISSEDDDDQSFACFLRDNVCRAGLSNFFSDIRQCMIYMHEADMALELGSQQNPTFWLYRFEDHVFPYIVQRSTETLPKSELISPVLKTLRAYDQKHPGASLYDTLYQYFLCGYNASMAARSLHIHRTTFLYRMQRIEELTKYKLDSPKNNLYLFFSYLLDKGSL